MIIVDVANAALPTPGASQVNETGASYLVRQIPARPYVAFGSKAEKACSEHILSGLTSKIADHDAGTPD